MNVKISFLIRMDFSIVYNRVTQGNCTSAFSHLPASNRFAKAGDGGQGTVHKPLNSHSSSGLVTNVVKHYGYTNFQWPTI